ncbi:MAG: tol-pal system protein YbgF [Lentisphaeria bacterium]|jgi:tol-pal system protein YbgF
MFKFATAAIVSIAAFSVHAQVEIVDRQLPSRATPSSAPSSPVKMTPAQPVSSNAGELYYQLQVLQQEVLELRGLAEEQAFQIKKLKQQRLDDYIDLDRRLSQLGQGSSSGGGSSEEAYSSQSAPVGEVSSVGELSSYKSAMNLLFKDKNYDQAVLALNKHMEAYPKGRYAANAQYWLGEIFLKKNDLEQARQWFSKLLGEFPEHSKVPDAQFKLGKVYFLLGDKATARTLLETVAKSNSNASGLAKDFLRTNF